MTAYRLLLSRPSFMIMALGIITLSGGLTTRGTTFDLAPGIPDGAAGSLREAITIANGNHEDDIINLAAGTYALTLSGISEDANASGDLDLNEAGHTITVRGAGASLTIIDASSLGDRAFDVHTGVAVVFEGVELTGGTAPSPGGDGGAILSSSADLNLTGVVLSNNSCPNRGGGIFAVAGSLTVADSAFTGNYAGVRAGAVHAGFGGVVSISRSTFERNQAGVTGGAIHLHQAVGVLNISESTIAENESGIGGAVFINESESRIVSSSFSRNRATESGGAIYANSGSHVDISNCRLLSNNGGWNSGGALSVFGDSSATVEDCDVLDNVVSGGFGGGLASAGILTVRRCVISGNSAGAGGGVSASGTLLLSDSVVANNMSGSSGGGLFTGGDVTISRCSISGNLGFQGGGIYSYPGYTVTMTDSSVFWNTVLPGRRGGGIYNSGTFTLINSTVSGNSAFASGGGIQNDGSLGIRSSTIVRNAACDIGGGIFNSSGAGASSVNSIVAFNQAGFGPDAGNQGAFDSLGHNVVRVSDGFSFSPGPGDLTGTANFPFDPFIGPLLNNGGPTPTHALLTGSSLIDAGDNSGAPATDQRGLPRIIDGDGNDSAVIDIGAFERSDNESAGEPLNITGLMVACPPDRSIATEDIPDLRSEIALSGAPGCVGVLVSQSPPPGTAVGCGTHLITVTVRLSTGQTLDCLTHLTVPGVAPRITGISGPVAPITLGTVTMLSVAFDQADNSSGRTCRIEWGDGSTETITGANASGLTCTAQHVYANPGVYRVTAAASSGCGVSDPFVYEFVVIYDPNGGFVTGGGWINSPAGAYNADPSLTGKANFGFVSKYQKGATVPTGDTEFQFKAGNLNFKSISYDWLVVAGAKAQYKGGGTVNGAGDYRFVLTVTDGQVSGAGGVDRFRIKIWNKSSGGVIYDNQLNAPDEADATQAIVSGSIVVHKP